MSDDAQKKAKLDEVVSEAQSDLQSSSVADDVSFAHEPETGTDAAEDADLHDDQKTSPAKQGEQSFSGGVAALTSDDDIDELGEEYGVEYEDDEELNIGKKINAQTQLDADVGSADDEASDDGSATS